ncbi:MAG TPA: universal stress protein [Gemmatimonadota bacterium]|nr:universal stress protein [Gemmatimonadota bacterium]
MILYANVLLATDFSRPAAYAADHAAALARATGAVLHLIHVVEDFSYWESFSLKHFPSPDVFDELKESARLALEDLFPSDDRAGFEVRTHVRHGKPFIEIIRAARDLTADVIVVGSHGQSGVAEALFGSTAEKVVRKASCAVLVVRHPDHTFSMP